MKLHSDTYKNLSSERKHTQIHKTHYYLKTALNLTVYFQ